MVHSTSSSWIITSFFKIFIAYNSSVPFLSANTTWNTQSNTILGLMFESQSTMRRTRRRRSVYYSLVCGVNFVVLKIITQNILKYRSELSFYYLAFFLIYSTVRLGQHLSEFKDLFRPPDKQQCSFNIHICFNWTIYDQFYHETRFQQSRSRTYHWILVHLKTNTIRCQHKLTIQDYSCPVS